MQCGTTGQSYASGELSNEEFTILVCNKNHHETKYFLATPDYSLYFDHGIDALIDKNYFEAFTSVYHAWEKFILTFTKCCLLNIGISDYNELQEATKVIAKQSVQVEGAFAAAYIAFLKEQPPVLPNKLKSLRNQIIHGIRNPQKEDVEQCVITIYNFIKQAELKLLTGNNSPYVTSYFEIYGDNRVGSLKKAGILTDDDLKSKRSVLFADGSKILGMTPSTSSTKEAKKILTFEEIIERRTGMKKLNDMMSELSQQ